MYMMETVLLCHDITEILLKVALNTITPNLLETVWGQCKYRYIIWRPSSVNFSHFKLLLRNHWADWNQT